MRTQTPTTYVVNQAAFRLCSCPLVSSIDAFTAFPVIRPVTGIHAYGTLGRSAPNTRTRSLGPRAWLGMH